MLHVVMERGASPGNDLLHLVHDGVGFSSGLNPTTNGSPRNPDLAAMGESLALVWASNSVFPGIQLMERGTYEGGAWTPPETVSLALGISSPSVAYDGDSQILYAWIMDNELVNGIPPLVHTQFRPGAEVMEPRARPGRARCAVPDAAYSVARSVRSTAKDNAQPGLKPQTGQRTR